MRVDAAILTALPKEHHAVTKVLSGLAKAEPYRGSLISYSVYHFDGLSIAVPDVMGMGVTYSALAASNVINDLSSKLLLLSGIAGCMHAPPAEGKLPEIELGDIVISTSIIDYTMEKDKEEVIKDEKMSDVVVRLQEPRKVELLSSEAVIREVQRELEARPGFHDDRLFDKWWDSTLIEPRTEKTDVGSSLQMAAHPAIHFGKVLSGNSVMASKEGKKELLKQIDKPKPLAIEMEAAGIAKCLKQLRNEDKPEFAMVKSLCDWAEGSKDDSWHTYCSHVSALYCLRVIRLFIASLPQGPSKIDAAFDELKQKTAAANTCFYRSVGVRDEFLATSANKISDSAIDEVFDLVDGKYEVDLGTSKQFLLRAMPFFENASRVYATSLDSISTFWTNLDTRIEAHKYVKSQANTKESSAHRLFIFSTPENAHLHGKILDAHCEQYKNVYVCSREHYTTLVPKFISQVHAESYRSRDFAILDFDRGVSYLAELDHRRLRLDPVDPNSSYVNTNNTREFFEGLKDLEVGKFDESRQVIRWTTGLWNWTQQWPVLLKKMFEEPLADVIHTVTFDTPPEADGEIRSLLAKVKYDLLERGSEGKSFREKYNVKQVWLAKPREYDETSTPRDGVVNGKLHISRLNARRFMLIVQFGSPAGLDSYYKDKNHAKMRLELYSCMDRGLKEFIERIGSLVNIKDISARRNFSEMIEEIAAHKMHRFDFIEDEMIEHMIRSAPYDF